MTTFSPGDKYQVKVGHPRVLVTWTRKADGTWHADEPDHSVVNDKRMEPLVSRAVGLSGPPSRARFVPAMPLHTIRRELNQILGTL